MGSWGGLCSVLVWVSFLLGSANSDAADFKIPSYVEVCYRDDPKVADCIRRNIEKLPPLFRSGSTDFDVQPLDPMLYSNISFAYESPLIGGKVFLPSSSQLGLTRFNVLDVRPNLKNPRKFILDFDLNFPHLNSKTTYKLSGNVVAIPINFKGRVDAHFEDVNITYHIDGDVKTIGDYDYLILNSFTWNFKGKGMRRVYLANDDLVEGMPAINQMAKNIVASSWRQLHRHVSPAFTKTTDESLRDVFKNLFKKYPYDVLFPKRTRKINAY